MLLTATQSSVTLSMPLTHSRDGIETPHIGQKRPLSKVVFLCPLKSNTGYNRILSFMVGCIEQPLKRLAVPLCGSLNLIQPTAQDLRLKSGGLFLNKGHKPMLNHTQKLTLTVSKNKKQSLQKQVEIIGSSLDSFCLYPDTQSHGTLKADALELVRMLEELEQNTPRKTSLFNVLAKDTRQLIAEQVSFNFNLLMVQICTMVGGAA